MPATEVGRPMVTVTPLPWDSEFFGFPVARLLTGGASALAEAVGRLHDDGVRLAYLELDQEDSVAAREAIRLGGRLVDQRVELAANPRPAPGAADVEIIGTEVSQTDREALRQLAFASGEMSRFRTDPGIPAGRFEALYETWINNSIARRYADAVLVLRATSQIAGMITLASWNRVATIGLFAVDGRFRGRGLGRRLLEQAFAWAHDRDCVSLRVATQGDNAGALAAYRSVGFAVDRTADTYHFWIDT